MTAQQVGFAILLLGVLLLAGLFLGKDIPGLRQIFRSAVRPRHQSRQ